MRLIPPPLSALTVPQATQSRAHPGPWLWGLSRRGTARRDCLGRGALARQPCSQVPGGAGLEASEPQPPAARRGAEARGVLTSVRTRQRPTGQLSGRTLHCDFKISPSGAIALAKPPFLLLQNRRLSLSRY